MRKYIFILFGLVALRGTNAGMEVKDFWDAKNCIIRSAKFSEDTGDVGAFRVEYTVLRTPEGAPVGNQYCIFVGEKKMFTPLSYYRLARLDDRRTSLESPRVAKYLAREVERMKETGKRQRALEYGYLVPIFMDLNFPQIKDYAEPPKSILGALSKREGVIYDIYYPVDVDREKILISSIVATRKEGEEVGKFIEERKEWEGGPFEVSWAEVLPEEFKKGVYYAGTQRKVETLKKVRINYELLDSLCRFPQYIPGKEEGEMDSWVREAEPGIISNFAWRKGLFNSLMEVGYFASFFAKYIFPRIRQRIEIPSRFQKEGFVVTYFTEADVSGVTVHPEAEGLGEEWVGRRELITWDDVLPERLKKE